MKARVLLLTGAVVLSAAGCAALQAAARGDLAGAAQAGANEAKAIADSEMEAQRLCDPILKSTVSWPEERAIGGAIAIALTQNTKAHYFLDGMTEKDPAKLKAMVDRGEKVGLSASEKNSLAAYVAVVGKTLSDASDRADIAWTFGVLDSPTANAFSAPGGYVIITTGLLKLLDNEAQLAGVLAHEIGHVNSRHALEAYKTSKHTTCKLAIHGQNLVERGIANIPGDARALSAFGGVMRKALAGGGALDLDGGEVGGGLIAKLTDLFVSTFLGKGMAKEQELEADKTTLELLLAAGYDSTQYDALLKKLPSGGGTFDNHPSNDDRIASLNALRAGDYAGFANGKARVDNPPALKVVKK